MEQEKEPPPIKIVFLYGSFSAGKTSLLTRYISDEFSNKLPTIGMEFVSKLMTIDGKRVKVLFWESGVVEREFESSALTSYYRNAHGVIGVYDLTNKSSFECLDNCFKTAIPRLMKNTKFLLLGAKKDLEEDRQVPTDVGQKFADKIGARFFEVSAKENESVKEALDTLVADMTASPWNLGESQPKKESGCSIM